MKRSITISILLVLVLVLSIVGVLYIRDTSNLLVRRLDQAAELIRLHEFDSALEELEAIQTKWEHSGDIIDTYVNHQDIDAIEEELIQLCSYTRQKEEHKAVTAIESIQFKLRHIYESELPLPKNIF